MMTWKEYRIKQLSTQIGSGTTPKSGNELYYENGTIHWINTGDLNNGDVYSGKQKITLKAIAEVSSLRFYPVDSVLIAMYGASIGKTGLLKVKATVNQACCVIVPNSAIILPKFLFYYLTNNKEELIRESVGGTQPNVSQTIVSNLKLFVPGLTDQKRIINYLDNKSNEIEKQINILLKKQNAFTRLKSSIINRAVTKGLNSDVKLKESGIDWIGEIPEHWKCIRNKDSIQLLKGKTPTNFTFEVSGLPYLNMDYLRDREDKPILYPTNPEGLVEITEQEILVLWDGANAGEFIHSKKGYLGSTMAMLKIDETRYNKRYFYALLKSIEGTSKYFANGTTIPHFDSNVLFGYSYPVPPLEEQQAIANYLDEKCAKIDAAIANIEKQIDALKRLKRALINEVVTGKREV